MLDNEFIEQLKGVFANLSATYTLAIKANSTHESYAELLELLSEFASCSDKIACTIEVGEAIAFSLLKEGEPTGITFRAIPTGHEFTSLILAVLNADGKGKNLPDEFTTSRIQALRGAIRLTTYMSLTCTNCPDVVQALNIMALLNKGITHEAVDGAIYQEEVDNLHVQAVPTVYADGKPLHVGRGGVVELLEKLEALYGSETTTEAETREYDLVVAGGGPAGVTAAIYSARKGLQVAVVAGKIGGQVNETTAIENIPSVIETTGTQLANDLRTHAQHYSIDILENRTIERFEVEGIHKLLHIKGGETIKAPQLIVATGANWRRLNIDGESEYIGRGVAFCPHCDGPLFKDKRVAVIGGGNSGVEAAIDLAGICTEVTVFEFLDTLKADTVLQEKLKTLPNVTLYTSTATTEIVGDGTKVTAIRKKDRVSGEEQTIELDGVFIQIGLSANSSLFAPLLETNMIGEIIIDNNCRTSLAGVYAAGDVSTVSYKQVVISMGEGAKAALAAFDDRIRGI